MVPIFFFQIHQVHRQMKIHSNRIVTPKSRKALPEQINQHVRKLTAILYWRKQMVILFKNITYEFTFIEIAFFQSSNQFRVQRLHLLVIQPKYPLHPNSIKTDFQIAVEQPISPKERNYVFCRTWINWNKKFESVNILKYICVVLFWALFGFDKYCTSFSWDRHIRRMCDGCI